ncbi:hypothetical protein ACG2LH_09660 [Zhouia sp. PK063]|uniref:hypothetical protein n=1 Tax=Zhouia sp. PK063 TaxID=3373602 RepID=UPI0037910410
MIKKIFVILAFMACAINYAQEGSASPYSYYGVGDLKFKGLTENKSMGGLSVYSDSIHLNLNNPASLSSLRLTTFTVGGSHKGLTLDNGSTSDKVSNTSFDYLAIGLPVSDRFGIGFGVLPYTAVGYKLSTIIEGEDITSLRRFEGSGGLNKVYFSFGWEIFKGFSLGATGNYNFGDVNTTSVSATDNVQYSTKEANTSSMNGFEFNLGARLKTKINKKLTLHASAVYTPEATINSENTRRISTVTFSTNGQEATSNYQDIDLQAQGLKSTEIKMPSSATFGLGFGQERKWFLGGEVELKKMGDFSNPFNATSFVHYQDAKRISLGGFFIPDYNSFSSYLKRVVYRAGFKAESTGLVVNNEALKDFGISFGVGLPLGQAVPTTKTIQYANMFSNINFGVEIGKRGTTDSGNIQENYVNFSISLSFNDLWFQKRKFD